MRVITLEELLEAGCHFGHQVSRQNPKTRDFVFEARDNIHIIDLEKTKEGLEAAGAFIKKIAEKPESTFIILGTKRQAEATLKEEIKRAQEAGMDSIYSVTARWIGGTMTNFGEVTKNYKKLKDLNERIKNDYEKSKYTKKEVSLWEKELQKLIIYYGGTKDMTKIPDVIFVIDTHLEDLAVREARSMGVPVVGIVDTNADPDLVDYPIPANDDASGSIKLILSYIIDAWIEGKKNPLKVEEEPAKSEESSVKSKKEEEKKETKETKTIKKEAKTKKVKETTVTKSEKSKSKTTSKK